jgi:hypothetical protein
VPTSLATHDPTDPLHQTTVLPDLVASSGDPAPVDERAPPRLCGIVTNVAEGSLVATPFTVQLRLEGSPVNETTVVERLGPYQGVTVCWTLGEPLRRGIHRFEVVADAREDVPEQNETNNAAASRAFYVAPAPQGDLRVRSVQVNPRVARMGQYQVFAIQVQNAGSAPTAPTTLEVRDDNGVMGTLLIPTLDPQQTETATLLTDPSTRPIGNFTAVARLDPTDALPELREDNNVGYSTYEIPPRPLPDLVVLDAAVNGTPVARRGLRMDVTLANVGARPAALPLVRLLEGEVTLANATRQSLDPGANATFRFHFVLPAGEHVLRVVADPDGALIEANETNNAFPVALTVASAGNGTDGPDVASPNLLVRQLDAGPTDPGPGEAVLLSALVSNAGDAPSNLTSVAFYADGKLLGRKPVPPLDPDRHTIVPFSWGTSTPGDHDLRAVVDPDDAVREADERDNDLLSYVALLPPRPQAPPPTNVTMPEPLPETPAEGSDGEAGGDGSGGDPPAPGPAKDPVAVGELSIRTVQVPGALKGVLVVAIRNTGLEPVGRLTVAFSVDGRVVKEVLVNGLGAAASAPASTGELDLPEGRHSVKAEVRVLGSDAEPLVVQGTYEAKAGERGIPGPGVALVAACVGCVALLLRRRR